MTHFFSPQQAVLYLQQFLTNNKARGMMAEIALDTTLRVLPAASKVIAGCWFLSPKVPESYRYRYAVFVLPELYSDQDEVQAAIGQQAENRAWQALATFLHHAGIGVVVTGATPISKVITADALQWHHYLYQNERLSKARDDGPFAAWPGNRGKASKGAVWLPEITQSLINVGEQALTELVLRQAFFYGYLKQHLRKPIDDPYDVDAFVVGFRGDVLPVEVKEKSRTNQGNFGIDAGRILMLLRLCLATDSNALYLIREVDNTAERGLIGWQGVTLAEMVMGCSWNLQAGGKGMGGGTTQTIMMPGSLFRDFSDMPFSEDWIDAHKSLQSSVRGIIAERAAGLENYLR